MLEKQKGQWQLLLCLVMRFIKHIIDCTGGRPYHSITKWNRNSI